MHVTHTYHNRFAKKETRPVRFGITRGQALLFIITFSLFFYMLSELVFASEAHGSASSPDQRIVSVQTVAPVIQEVTVREGDSLWKLASRYQDETSMDVNQLIQEIKVLNQLESPIIYPGQSLLIPMS
ncbi:cell division suppressor protein YneA [Brevibacillus panacihumi]|uniref:LysM peptidoglycan-binding domain-containing protein n=1 Tax=Brevibacillus panacihumi TaxID=497735 RepID=A0A3M8CNK4_9BACL|nr:LysM peptidoglycan-binding domain-containing protein [Brevibacillus panacihumi]RNB77314.1 LysM peptidoglycan-binding domain-containing protein [Brevibacillus panacihumi]